MTAYNVVSPASLQSGQPEDVSVVLANLQAIASVLNGGLDNGNIHPAAAIVASKLAGYPSDGSKALLGDGSWGGVQGTPTGAVIPYAAATPPAGWLVCDGSLVSRMTYAPLFGVIAELYGAGDGTTTFGLPDLQARAPVGKGSHVDVDTIGKNDGVAVASRTNKHRHTVNDPGHTHAQYGQGGSGPGSANFVLRLSTYNDYGLPETGSKTTGITVGPAGAALDGAPYLVMPYIIKT
jgi:microcystin-dependent protein